MESTSATQVRTQARRASDSPAAHGLARAGLTARGIIYILIGLVAVLVVEGFRRKFMKFLRTARMSPRTRRVVRLLGTVGTVARGVVFALAGVLVIEAAITHKASQSGGIDKALLTLRNQPFGEFLMLAAALGLLIFGVYGLCEARWRRV